MDMRSACEEIQSGLKQNAVVTVFCRCSVSYSGRAESELGEGDRLLIVKQDNALLVHQPEGSTPINYMKDGSKVDAVVRDGSLVLESQNLSDKDFLEVTCEEVYSVSSRRLVDGAELRLVGTEEDMSDMIREEPGVIGEWFNPVSREEHTSYGFIDVFGHDKEGNFVVVECKRYTAGVSAVQQLRRYVEKVASLKGVGPERVRGVLAAPSVAKNALDMAENWGYEYRRVEPPRRQERFKKGQKSLSDF